MDGLDWALGLFSNSNVLFESCLVPNVCMWLTGNKTMDSVQLCKDEWLTDEMDRYLGRIKSDCVHGHVGIWSLLLR